MSGGTDHAGSIVMIRNAIERGVLLIDAAPMHGFCHSEAGGWPRTGRAAPQGRDRNPGRARMR